MNAPSSALRVLVVDDNVDAADSLAEVLKLLDHDARAVYGGRPAVAEARTFAPQVVLLDLSMPDIDGFETLKLLRTEDGAAKAHIIAMTGHSGAEDIARCRAAGFDEHLTKPVTIDQLMQSLDAIGR